MAGSQPGELTILLPPSLFLPVSVSVNVCHFLYFFLSSAPAALVSVGVPCCLSLGLFFCPPVSLYVSFYVCMSSWHCTPVLQTKFHQFVTTWIFDSLGHHCYLLWERCTHQSSCWDQQTQPPLYLEVQAIAVLHCKIVCTQCSTNWFCFMLWWQTLLLTELCLQAPFLCKCCNLGAGLWHPRLECASRVESMVRFRLQKHIS